MPNRPLSIAEETRRERLRNPLSIAEETRREKLIKRTQTLKHAPKHKKPIKTIKEKKADAKKKEADRKRKLKQIKKMEKSVEKTRVKHHKELQKKKPKKSRAMSKIVPLEISRTKIILRGQERAKGNIDILQEELENLISTKNRILQRDTIEENFRSIIPSSSANSIRIINDKIRNNVEEQNELIDRFAL